MSANIFVSDNPFVKHFLGLLRRKNCEHNQYRKCLSQLYVFLVYEAMHLIEPDTFEVDIETTDGGLAEKQQFMVSDNIMIVAMMRGGLGAAVAIQDLLPRASVAHVDIRSGKGERSSVIEYERFPAGFAGGKVIVVSPRIETGSSIVSIVDTLLGRYEVSSGDIVVLNAVCSPQGAFEILEKYPDLRIVSAALEDGLSEGGRVLPGIGNTGKKLYGVSSLDG